MKPVQAVRHDVALGALAALLISSACSAFDDLKVASSKQVAPAACKLAKPFSPGIPVPPTMTDYTFTVGWRRIDLGEARVDAGVPDFSNVGFDLDNTCTTSARAYTCRKPSWANTNLDGDGGRDNSLLRFFEVEDGGSQGLQISDTAERGLVTAVFVFSGYNGSVSDGDVDVAAYGASMCHLEGIKPVCPGVGDGGPPPAWLGTDVWKPMADWVEQIDGGQYLPKYRSSTAYVTNRRLVAHFPQLLLAFGIHLTDVWLQADLKQVGPHEWALRNGVIASRAKVDDLLAALEFYIEPGTKDKPICTDSPSYAAAKRRTCAVADISSTGNDAAAPCDAASWAFTFDGEPVRLSPSEVFQVGEKYFRTCDPRLSPKRDHCGSVPDASVE